MFQCCALYIMRRLVHCRSNRYHHLCLTMKVLIIKLLEVLIIVIITQYCLHDISHAEVTSV